MHAELDINLPIWGIITIILVIAKVMNLIDLSWTWDFAPLWVPVLIVVAFYLLTLLFVGVTALFIWIANLF
jgi:hypothetical protein